MTRERKNKPRIGSIWRTSADPKGYRGERMRAESNGSHVFDELVIDDWLHLEQLNHDTWWLRVGDMIIDVRIDPSRKVVATITNKPLLRGSK